MFRDASYPPGCAARAGCACTNKCAGFTTRFGADRLSESAKVGFEKCERGFCRFLPVIGRHRHVIRCAFYRGFSSFCPFCPFCRLPCEECIPNARQRKSLRCRVRPHRRRQCCHRQPHHGVHATRDSAPRCFFKYLIYIYVTPQFNPARCRSGPRRLSTGVFAGSAPLQWRSWSS